MFFSLLSLLLLTACPPGPASARTKSTAADQAQSQLPLMLDINLPWPILAHALGLLVIGLALTFLPPRPGSPPQSMLGISCLAIALAYLTTAYVPLAENVFLHASVPVRIALGSVAAVKWLLVGGVGEDANSLRVVAIYDGGGGFLLGWWLGRWDGRIH